MARPKYGISGSTSSLLRSTTSERDREFRVSTSGSPLGTNLVKSQTFLSRHGHPVMYAICQVCMWSNVLTPSVKEEKTNEMKDCQKWTKQLW